MNMNETLIESVWKKANQIDGYDDTKWRKDFAGAWIQRNQLGIRSEYGWEIDHIKPKSMGGSDDESNLIPMHWRNNVCKANNYPVFTSMVSSDGNKNIDKEQSWKISK